MKIAEIKMHLSIMKMKIVSRVNNSVLLDRVSMVFLAIMLAVMFVILWVFVRLVITFLF